MRKPSLQATYIKYSIISCLVISVLTILALPFYAGIPLMAMLEEFYFLISIVMITSVVIGAAIGFTIGIYVNRSFNDLSRALLELERGNFSYQLGEATFREFEEIERRFHELSQKSKGQALTFQKSTNEWADKEQEILEQAISQERNRLARELHDSVSQQLFAISMMSSAINETEIADTSLKKKLQVVEEMSIQAQGEMRALLLHLRPVQLEGKKLVDGINELLNELSMKQHMEITWHTDQIELEKGVEDHLFRILQEAISNTLRHGEAKHLEVRLRKIGNFAILKVIDDGIGFDPKVRKAGSYGLDSMEERTKEIGGAMKIVSILHKGTQIEVKVPLEKEVNGGGEDDTSATS